MGGRQRIFSGHHMGYMSHLAVLSCFYGATLVYSYQVHFSYRGTAQPMARSMANPAKHTVYMKGFGKQKTTPKPPPPSPAQQQREAAGDQLAEMRAKGLPEYAIFVRAPKSEKLMELFKIKDGWIPVGSLCAPRSASVVSAVSSSIFQNEEQLKMGAYRISPELKEF